MLRRVPTGQPTIRPEDYFGNWTSGEVNESLMEVPVLKVQEQVEEQRAYPEEKRCQTPLTSCDLVAHLEFDQA